MQRDHLLFRMGVHWRTALQLRQIRKLVDEGVVGGEQDGEITLMEYRRLEFYRWQRNHDRLPKRNDEPCSISSEEMKDLLDWN